MRRIRARANLRRRLVGNQPGSNTPSSMVARKLTWWEKVDILIAIIANLTVIGALILAWWSYEAQQNQAQRDATYQIITKFNSGELLATQRRFSKEILRLPLESLKDEILPRDTMATLLEQLVDTSKDPETLVQDILTIVSYLDDVQICIETGTCSQSVIQAHLGDSAIRYACITLPYLDVIKDKILIDGAGKWLRKLSNYESNC